MKKPYAEVHVKHNQCIRVFDAKSHNSELVWHRDQEDRTIELLIDTDWKLQLDNEIPVSLDRSQKYFIPREVYHRIIKGSTDLIIRVTKHELDTQ